MIATIDVYGLYGPHSGVVARQVIRKGTTENCFSTTDIAGDYRSARHSRRCNTCKHRTELPLFIFPADEIWWWPIVGKRRRIEQDEARANPIQVFSHRGLPLLAVLEDMECHTRARPRWRDACARERLQGISSNWYPVSHCFSPRATSSSKGVIRGLAYRTESSIAIRGHAVLTKASTG